MKKLWICLLAFVILTGCNLPAGQVTGRPLNLPPQTWIDAPLTNSQLPLAPYEVVFHGSDPAGVVQGEFSVNGEVQVNQPNSDTGNHLVVFRVNWTPSEPGEYTLRARTLNSSGAWSDYAEAVVIVGGPSPTPVITVTPTSVITVTPTSVITVTPTLVITGTPTPVPAAGFSNRGLSTNTVSRGRCNPSQVTIQVDAQHAAGVNVVVLFFRLEDTQSGELSAWNDGLAMNLSSGHYTRTLSGDQLAKQAGFDQARVYYQFVLQPKQGEFVRSEVYSDLYLTPCGGAGITPVVPGGIILRPTLTPEVVK